MLSSGLGELLNLFIAFCNFWLFALIELRLLRTVLSVIQTSPILVQLGYVLVEVSKHLELSTYLHPIYIDPNRLKKQALYYFNFIKWLKAGKQANVRCPQTHM